MWNIRRSNVAPKIELERHNGWRFQRLKILISWYVSHNIWIIKNFIGKIDLETSFNWKIGIIAMLAK